MHFGYVFYWAVLCLYSAMRDAGARAGFSKMEK
jgi:hypothetical protein